MFDINKFKAELMEAKAENETVKADGLQHAKSFLKPFLEIAEAANSVYQNKITVDGPRADGFAYSTTLNVDGNRIVFITQPGHEKFTIRGLDDELAKAMPPEEKPKGFQASLSQMTDGRSIRVQDVDLAANAFAAHVKWRLTLSRNW